MMLLKFFNSLDAVLKRTFTFGLINIFDRFFSGWIKENLFLK